MKITVEEAESRLAELLEILRERDLIEPENDETLLMAITALRFQERHRSRKLSEEKPPKEGDYLVWNNRFPWATPYVLTWNGRNEDAITHWAYLLDNPTEEA